MATWAAVLTCGSRVPGPRGRPGQQRARFTTGFPEARTSPAGCGPGWNSTLPTLGAAALPEAGRLGLGPRRAMSTKLSTAWGTRAMGERRLPGRPVLLSLPDLSLGKVDKSKLISQPGRWINKSPGVSWPLPMEQCEQGELVSTPRKRGRRAAGPLAPGPLRLLSANSWYLIVPVHAEPLC